MYKCKKCNSSDVEELVWANMNTLKLSDEYLGYFNLDDATAHYCNECQDKTEIYIDENEKINSTILL